MNKRNVKIEFNEESRKHEVLYYDLKDSKDAWFGGEYETVEEAKAGRKGFIEGYFTCFSINREGRL